MYVCIEDNDNLEKLSEIHFQWYFTANNIDYCKLQYFVYSQREEFIPYSSHIAQCA
jgi:hypothetical protein